MIKNSWLLLVAFAFAAGCATQEPPKPAPPPAPPPAPEPEVKPAPPAPKPKPAAEKVTSAGTVHFDFDKAELRPDGKATLDELASKVRGINLEVVIAIGHADMIGSDAYNQKLSVRRAEAIKAYLVTKGIETNRIYTEGKGEKQPVTGDKCKALSVAQLHLLESRLPVRYEKAVVEDFAAAHAGEFDAVTCMELLEHVPQPASMVAACAKLVRPGGQVFFSTINRNPKAYLFAV